MIRVKTLSPIYSKLLLKGGLFFALTGWAVTATWIALTHRPEKLIITLDHGVPSVVNHDLEKKLNEQKWELVKEFFFRYYTYDAGNFDKQVGKASNAMAHSLVVEEMPKVLEVRKVVLADSTFNQKIEKYQRIVEETPLHFEAQFELLTRSGFNEKKVRLKVRLDLARHEETERNPWAFEVVHLSEEVLPKS